MKTVLLDLFTSKKFLAAVSAIVIYMAGRFGFDIDPEALDRILGILMIYLAAQGAADIGKSAAKVNAVSLATSVTANRSVPPGVTPTASATAAATESATAMERIAKVAIVLLVLGAAAGCNTQQVASGVRSGMGCEQPGIAAAANELYAWATERISAALVGGEVDGTKLRAAMTNVLDPSPRCAIEAVIAAMATPTESARSRSAAPAVDGAALRAEYRRQKIALGWDG